MMRVRNIVAALAGAALLTASPAAGADQFAYGAWCTGYSVQLNRVDLTTSYTTLVGTLSQLIEGLAESPDGKLYGTDASGALYIINTKTAHKQYVGSTGRGDIEGLDFYGSALLGVDFNATPTVFYINTANAQTTNIVTALQPTGVVRAMAVLDRKHVLVVADGPPANTMYAINLSSGVVVTIGTLATPLVAAMDFAGGTLYALDETGGEWTIDPTNAQATPVGNTGGQYWLDMAVIPPLAGGGDSQKGSPAAAGTGATAPVKAPTGLPEPSQTASP